MHKTPLRGPILALALLSAALPAALPGVAQATELPDFVTLVKQASPAVVNISTTQKIARGPQLALPEGGIPGLPEGHPFGDLFKRFFEQMPPGAGGPQDRAAQSLGSGFIISADGYILTNAHVVKGADSINVRLDDKQEYTAKLVGMDERTDVAVLKVEASGLPVVRIGDSDKLNVGEWVLAIGSPFGLDHTATQGIVSALARNLPNENYVPFIQTDVAVNPGNSGGPLFNTQGEVVGINSQIYTRSGGYMGLSFAIPINVAMQVAEQIKTQGHVTRGWLGVMIQPVTADLAKSFGLEKARGALVAQVTADSPAEKAGLREGDIILRFDGHEISESSQLPARVGATAVGRSVPVVVLRDGKETRLEVTIQQLQDGEGGALAGSGQSVLGMNVTALDAPTRKELKIEGGLRVTQLNDGPAARAGIRPGDVLLEINGEKLTKPSDLEKAAKALPKNKPVAVRLLRDGTPMFLALRLE
ncbi:MAG: DegQ family serine endoprotease [Pseudomonadota bacterium]